MFSYRSSLLAGSVYSVQIDPTIWPRLTLPPLQSSEGLQKPTEKKNKAVINTSCRAVMGSGTSTPLLHRMESATYPP